MLISLRPLVFVVAMIAPFAVSARENVSVQLIGAPQDTDLLAELTAASTLVSSDAEDPADILAEARGDYTRLVEALYARGHYSAVVHILLDGREAAQFAPFAEPDRIDEVRILIDPGPHFTFGRAEIGPLVSPKPGSPDFRSGAPALASVVRDAVQDAVSDWRQAGHAKARIDGQSIVADHASAKLDVGIALAPGPRLRFGEVRIISDSGVRDARIRQIAGLPRGEVFDPDAVDKAASRLRRTGTFKSVTVAEAEHPDEAGRLDMEITVVDQKIRRLGAGAEFSSVDGLTLSANWLHRNILGGAERFRTEAKIAQINDTGEGVDYALSLNFEKPAVYGADTHFTSALSFSFEDEPDYSEGKAALTFGASREFSDHLTGDLGFGVSYSEVTDKFPESGAEFREMLLYNLPATLTYDRRNDLLDTTNGYYLSGTLEPFFVSTESLAGARFTFDARAFHAWDADENVVLAGRLKLGALIGPEADKAPPGYLFYSGGGGTVRGQPYHSLDAEYGDVSLGGRGFAALSTEMRISVTDTWGMVAFADVGLISTESFGGGTSDWHAGAGLGLRYKTPVGPIRLDVAGPLTDNTADGFQVYIGIGQAF